MSEKSMLSPEFAKMIDIPMPEMMMRDYFAAHSIIGILANPDISASAARLRVSTEEFRADTARTAFQMADAMLASMRVMSIAVVRRSRSTASAAF